jgi:hypothetical protein
MLKIHRPGYLIEFSVAASGSISQKRSYDCGLKQYQRKDVSQPNPIESDTARSMLEKLMEDSRLYHKGAAGQVETLLGLAAHTKVDRPKKKTEPKPLMATSGDLFETSNS